jgi:hypothetical protein
MFSEKRGSMGICGCFSEHRYVRGHMDTPKFVHGDTVKLAETGQLGTVSSVHQTGNETVYSVRLETAAEPIKVSEGDLKLVKIANDDETGLHIRYIT